MFIELWMVGIQMVPHSNQDTQASIESYHGVLKCWLALDTKGLRGRRIHWLVWRLTTTIARHYMHTLEMKKKGFHKKQGYGGHYYTKCGKRQPLFHSPMCTNQPLKVMELGVYRANAFLMLSMWWNSHSLKYFVAHVNGHCEGTCVSTKLWSFSHAKIFLRRISFITMEHDMDHIVEGWVTFLRTHDIFQMIWSPMMMTKVNILKVMMGSWNLMGSWTWSKVISIWVPL